MRWRKIRFRCLADKLEQKRPNKGLDRASRAGEKRVNQCQLTPGMNADDDPARATVTALDRALATATDRVDAIDTALDLEARRDAAAAEAVTAVETDETDEGKKILQAQN